MPRKDQQPNPLKQLIKQKLEERDTFTVADITDEVIEELDARTIRSLLFRYKEPLIKHLVRQEISHFRNNMRQELERRALNDTLVAIEKQGKSVFDIRFMVGKEWKKLGDMRGEDHLHVANDYASRIERMANYENFHRSVARRVGNKRTKDVFSPQQLVLVINRYLEARQSLGDVG